METKKPNSQVDEQVDQAAAQKKEQMIKMVKYGSTAIAVIVALVLVYIYAFRNPAIAESEEAIADADIAFYQAGEDSAKMEQAFKKYEAVAQNYSQASGNLAKLMTAIGYYQKGEYQKCIDFIDDYAKTGAVLDAGVQSKKADCYVNLKKYDEALSCYDDAISIANDNPSLIPFLLAKKARVCHGLKDYAKELELYETIKKEYPAEVNFDIEKYISRAKALAEKK